MMAPMMSCSSPQGIACSGGAPPRATWRNRAIIGIKLVHSAIFLLNSAAVLHIFVAGVWNGPSRWTRAALAAALAEVAIFVANRGRCPLTDLVEHLGAESGRVSDIFLPRWFADRIPQLCGPLLLIGMLALLGRSGVDARLRSLRNWPPYGDVRGKRRDRGLGKTGAFATTLRTWRLRE